MFIGVPGNILSAVKEASGGLNVNEGAVSSAVPVLVIVNSVGKACGVFMPIAEGPKSMGPGGALKFGDPCITHGDAGSGGDKARP
jgi:hypothetical protein